MDETKQQTRSVTVLVVEDDENSLNYLLLLLKKLKVRTLAARSGEEALELLKDNKNPVDFMLLDINLGRGISGLELMEKWRQEVKFANTPMIAVTAYYEGGMHKELLEAGFNKYLGKPYYLTQLSDILEI